MTWTEEGKWLALHASVSEVESSIYEFGDICFCKYGSRSQIIRTIANSIDQKYVFALIDIEKVESIGKYKAKVYNWTHPITTMYQRLWQKTYSN